MKQLNDASMTSTGRLYTNYGPSNYMDKQL